MNGTSFYLKLVASAALVVAGAAIFLTALLFTRLATTTSHTNAALCTFRSDVQQRINGTQAFLTDHPRGIPGVPVATLRQGLVAQRRTVRALSGLDCSTSR